MSELETLLYEERDGVAWLTLNRPEVHNAFNQKMMEELRSTWRSLRYNDDVRCVVLTGAGSKAFCAGVDRSETLAEGEPKPKHDNEIGFVAPWMYNDPGASIAPKGLGLWKPVIAAVNGMACGGAFYFLGEADIIIAAERATFFDPHVTFQMPAVIEPLQLLRKMPFHELVRLSLLGSDERMTARRAYEIGFVTDVVASEDLQDEAARVAASIAAKHPLVIGSTLRALWMGLELSRRQALDLADLMVRIGSDPNLLVSGQANFNEAPRPKPRLR